MTLYAAFIDPILHNPIVTGLSFTAILGAIGYQLRSIPTHLESLARRACIVKLTVNNSDPAFTWLDRWLAAQPYSKKAKSVVLKSYTDDEEGENVAVWEFSPGYGFHWFWWNKKLIWLNRTLDKGDNSSRRAVRTETIDIETFGFSQIVFHRMIEEAQQAVRERNLVRVYLWRGYWASVRGRRPRPPGTIILPEGQSDRILADMTWFMSSYGWYASRGIPWRRGYLLSGPPGTGKTSFVLAMAAHLKRPLCVLNMGSIDDDDALFRAVADAVSDAIILIEDIDCAGATHSRKADTLSSDKDDNDEKAGVTKAALLNVLDGITTPDGRIFILTTNHPEFLDPALTRPGRADVHETFALLGPVEQARMWKVYYSVPLPGPMPDRTIAPAELQGLFMRHSNDPDGAYKELTE